MTIPDRLYGRHKGRVLSLAQKEALKEILPKIELSKTVALQELHTNFLDNFTDLWMEIGFGNGENLIPQAIARPQTAFIGYEPFVNGVAHAVGLIHKHYERTQQEIKNVRIVAGDVHSFLPILPAHCASRIHVFYPDPWPKRRHRARRLLSRSFLQSLSYILCSGGELRFATDSDAYASFVLAAILDNTDFNWPAHKLQHWGLPWEDWHPTRYARRAEKLGYDSSYFTFYRN